MKQQAMLVALACQGFALGKAISLGNVAIMVALAVGIVLNLIVKLSLPTNV